MTSVDEYAKLLAVTADLVSRYRKRPVVIEARQFLTNNDDGSHIEELTQWAKASIGSAAHDGTSIYLETLEGTMRADVGDWIIKGVRGEVYPCKADIFEITYEPV